MSLKGSFSKEANSVRKGGYMEVVIKKKRKREKEFLFGLVVSFFC